MDDELTRRLLKCILEVMFMASYTCIPSGVCSQQISFDIDEGKIHNVAFVGGCNGNLKAIGKLLEGAEVENTIRLLMGNTCGARGTSCADQLAHALEEALALEKGDRGAA